MRNANPLGSNPVLVLLVLFSTDTENRLFPFSLIFIIFNSSLTQDKEHHLLQSFPPNCAFLRFLILFLLASGFFSVDSILLKFYFPRQTHLEPSKNQAELKNSVLHS